MGTTIHRPIEQVFDFMSSPENDSHWQYGTLASARLAESIGGSFFQSIGHLLGRRNLSTFEVTECEPNRKYGYKSLTSPVYLQTTHTFTVEDGGTRITTLTRARVVRLFQLDELIFGRRIKKQMKENFTVLKSILEANVVNLNANVPVL
jgi:hypothetical protein